MKPAKRPVIRTLAVDDLPEPYIDPIALNIMMFPIDENPVSSQKVARDLLENYLFMHPYVLSEHASWGDDLDLDDRIEIIKDQRELARNYQRLMRLPGAKETIVGQGIMEEQHPFLIEFVSEAYDDLGRVVHILSLAEDFLDYKEISEAHPLRT